ncbi:MAG: DUF4838 domain-containing protein [Planctomycetota bacterium]
MRTGTRLLPIAALLFAAACTARAGQHELTLVRQGEPAAAIVLAAEPTKVAQLAAYEFRHHVRLITGAELPIVKGGKAPEGTTPILLGESAAIRKRGLRSADFEPQEYLIQIEPDALVLTGRDKDERETIVYDPGNPFRFRTWPGLFDEQGTLYAVYDFLERHCGVRWFAPHEFGTVAPKRTTLTVRGGEVRRAPAFAYRDLGWVMRISEAYNAATSLWPRKAPVQKGIDQLAYPTLRERFPGRWKYIHAKRGVNRLFLHRHRLGGHRYQANHSFYGYYDRFWEKNPKCPEVFVEKRPQYFAQGYEGRPPQMCYTDDGFIRQVIADARCYFDTGEVPHRAVAFGDFFALVPMDNSSYCKCPDCQALTNREEADSRFFSNGYASDYVFGFANRVAKAISTSHPDKYLATLAYARYAYYPKRVRLESNIAVQLCLHVRNVYDPAVQANDLKFFRSWVTKEKDRPIYLWLYYCFPQERGARGGWHCFPGFFAHGAARWFRRFHRHGVRGAFFNGWGQQTDAYVTLKLLDDPTREVDAILDDYFKGYYGAAAEPMKRLYLSIEDTYSDPAHYPEGFSGHQRKKIAWEHLGTAERIERFGKLVARARQAATTEAQKRRVALFEREVWDYMVEGRKQYFARAQAPTATVRVPRVPAAKGDPKRVDWAKAADLGPWHKRTGGPADRKLSGRIAHDGSYLYLRLIERADPDTLEADGIVWAGDDWEIFIARQRKRPYRQLGVGPTDIHQALAHGEKGRTWDSGVEIVSDTSKPDRWTTLLALPLAKLVPGGAKPGDRLYGNIIRVLAPSAGRTIYVWSPRSTVHEPDRFGEIRLAP